MGTLKSLSRTAACAIFAGLILFLGASVAEASAPAPKCGGLNENVCTTAAAKYEKNSCPKGAFFDPRNGGECWDCPSGTHRTIFPVNEGKACERCASSDFHKAKYLGKTKTPKPSGAFFDPRKGGEWWKCPKDRPRRTAYAVTDSKACATKNILGEKLSRAEFLGKVDNPKPKGAFTDPRNGGEYWTCEGSNRTVFAVTDGKACEKITKAALMKAEFKGKFGWTRVRSSIRVTAASAGRARPTTSATPTRSPTRRPAPSISARPAIAATSTSAASATRRASAARKTSAPA